MSPSDGFVFSGPAAARVAGVSYRQLDYWARAGFVTPTRPATGKGDYRQYSSLDVLALRVAGHLRVQGVGLAAIQRAVAVLDEGAEVNRALTSYEFHVRGGRIFAMPRDGSPEIDIANGGQLMLAIDLRVRTRKELAKASARGSTARLLDEQVTLKRRKRRLA